MRILIRKIALSLILTLTLIQTNPLPAQGVQYNSPVSATSVNTAVTFTFSATSIVLKNDGPNSVFLNFTSTTATTSSFELKIGETLAISVDRSGTGWSGFGAICNGAQTATVRVLALKNI